MVARPGLVRFSARLPCPICGGWDTLPRGQGRRCGGYLSSDGAYAHCSREEYAGSLPQEEGGTFAHRLEGACRCGRTHGDAPAPLAMRPSANGHRSEPRPRELAVYRYRDATGSEAFQVVRFALPDGGKTFRQRHRGPDGEWVWKCPERLRVLYRLPELVAAPADAPVGICEGEKDADALAAWGMTATSAPMGAKAPWLPQYTAALRGRWCVLFPDNDNDGRAHMLKAAQALRGVAARVDVVDLPGLPPRGDVSDWLATNPTAEDLQALLDTRGHGPGVMAETTPNAAPGGPIRLGALLARGLPPITYVIERILPEGLTMLAGRPKQGKSFLALNLALAVAAGTPALGDLAVTRGSVLYLSLEGGEHGLVPRAETMLQGMPAPEALDVAVNWPRLDEGGVDQIGAWVRARADARLVIVDTLQRVRPPTGSGKSVYEQDYEALQSLIAIAQAARIALIVVHHTRKAAADDVLDTISGSTGLTGAVDAAWVLQRVRGQDTAVLAVTGRNMPEIDLGLRWHADLLTWQHTGSGQEARRSEERRAILRALEAEGGGPLTPQEVADLTDQEYHTVRKLLWLMERSGELKKEKGGYAIPLQ